MKISKKDWLLLFALYFLVNVKPVSAQLILNEGSNMNYSTLADEDGEYPDWVELYNAGNDTINLFNYSLSDAPSNPTKWRFPAVKLPPGTFMTVFCSGKDRKPVSGFVEVANAPDFTPEVGWNTHFFDTPFYWDGVSNILVNTCSYNSSQYTSNSVFAQTETTFYSTVYAFQDGSDASCSAAYGSKSAKRPLIMLDETIVGTAQSQNSNTEYPAPYGNWYWSARHQMLLRASELTQAGLSAGYINSLSFKVLATDPNTWYDYVDIQLKLVSFDELGSGFESLNPGMYQHTNFKLSENGESVNLYSPQQAFLSTLYVNCENLDVSMGRYPDGASATSLLYPATPSAPNATSNSYNDQLVQPQFSVPAGIHTASFSVQITNPNQTPCVIRYTTNGTDPTTQSPVYNGLPLFINQTTVLKAKAFSTDMLPSKTSVASYLFNISHQTPILSVVTDPANLYGTAGIFDNWWFDWEKAAWVDFFDLNQNLIFSRRAGMQIDGGWGGARAHPQHSFRIELDDGVLGDGPVNYPIIASIPQRSSYGKFYLRNGSNQYLILPYKEAAQTAMMANNTHNYHSAWEAVSVYINGEYFGLYDLREKMDTEYFEVWDGADDDQTDILSQSAWYGGILRPVVGSLEAFYDDFNAFAQIAPNSPFFWNEASQYFDLQWYADYIIGESWMGNTDWPWNNVKIVRSDKTNFTWRFCLMDMELAMLPNAWTDCYYDHIDYMLNYDQSNKVVNIWQRGMQNARFRTYFINRFADLMNTAYLPENLLAIENEMFAKMHAEMPHEFARWGDPNNIPAQMADFENNHLIFQEQLLERSNQVRNHLQAHFNLTNQVDVTLKVDPENAGFVKISTVIPDSYPWTGVYFNGVPVAIEAIANDPFTFKNWTSNGLIQDTLQPMFMGNLDATDIAFEAHFENTTSIGATEVDGLNARLFPNPAHDVVEVCIANKDLRQLQYQIIDVHGITIQQGELQPANGNASIQLNALGSGSYLLLLTAEKTDVVRLKFAKY